MPILAVGTCSNVRVQKLYLLDDLVGAPPHKSLKEVLSADAIAANPFMLGTTIARLVQKAAADVSATGRPGPSLGEPAVMAWP